MFRVLLAGGLAAALTLSVASATPLLKLFDQAPEGQIVQVQSKKPGQAKKSGKTCFQACTDRGIEAHKCEVRCRGR